MLATAAKPFHVMVKPIGSACNLACRYCYYLGKDKRLSAVPAAMDQPDLERFIRDYIAAQPGPEVQFAWQGGEPTLLGVGFFRKAVELQKKYARPNLRISNALQTNGTLIDDEWCEFFRENGFLIGLSIDGPRELHDAYRRDKGGAPTFDKVFAALQRFRRHDVQFNALVVVNRRNGRKGREVYRFLRDAGVRFMQFIACVERTDFEQIAPQHWSPQSLPVADDESAWARLVAPWAVRPDDYGRFLNQVFDEWIVADVGSVFVQIFDAMLGQWMGLGSSLCVFAPTCGAALVLEHDGRLYSCDHYVYPEYCLGPAGDGQLAALAGSPRQLAFGSDKFDRLPAQCRNCRWLFACNGECPKNRFLRTADGQAGLNYLCVGLQRFFEHVDPWMRALADLVRSGRPAADIMPAARARFERQRWASADRNGPCPCGSGRKFKKCCLGKSPGSQDRP